MKNFYNNELLGHILILLTTFIWGTTLISTKILLKDFQPIEILFFRFLIAFLVFQIVSPNYNYKTTKKQEVILMLAGLFGICLYYLLENTALIYTLASNVGVINCITPIITALIVFIFFKNKEKVNFNFIIGFILSITGISLIEFNGSRIHLNPLGDILAILAALSWVIYLILIKKLYNYGFSTLFIQKKIYVTFFVFL